MSQDNGFNGLFHRQRMARDDRRGLSYSSTPEYPGSSYHLPTATSAAETGFWTNPRGNTNYQSHSSSSLHQTKLYSPLPTRTTSDFSVSGSNAIPKSNGSEMDSQSDGIEEYLDAPAGLSHLPVLDAEVGHAFENVFVVGEGRVGNARTAQHLSSGPITTHPTSTNMTYRFAHFTAANMGKSMVEDDNTQVVLVKRRRLNPEPDKEKAANVTMTMGHGQYGRRQWTFPTEIWLRILEFGGLHVLIQAQGIHPSLRDILRENQSIWRNCRIQEYGTESPDPPPGMTDREFAILIAGKGCQLITCAKAHSTKAFWAFQHRLCEACYKVQIVKINELSDDMQTEPKRNLLDHIQAGIVKGGKYERSRHAQPDAEEWKDLNLNKLVFLRRDVAAIERLYDAAIAEGKTSEQIFTDLTSRHRSALELARSLEKIEVWEDTIKVTPKHRQDRQLFFIDRAAKLNPPISAEALEKMQPFFKGLDSNRAPNHTQFETLRSKIVPLREEAERIVRVDRITNRHSFGTPITDPQIATYINLHGRRSQGTSPEQQAVSQFAQRVLERLLNRPVADADLVLMVLREVKRTWRPNIVEGMLVNGEIGPYKLSMDDTKLVVEQIFRVVQTFNDTRRTAVILEKFRCPACPRNDKLKRYKFDELFHHLQYKHTRFASDYSCLRVPFARQSTGHQFPWYTIPWPENLPILANHQTPSSTTDAQVWDFNTPKVYEEAPPPTTTSAFAHKVIIPPPSTAADNFTACIIYAGEKLAPTELQRELQATLALKYALACYSSVHGPRRHPSISQLEEASRALISSTGLGGPEHKIHFRFACGVCTNDGTVSRSSQWVRNARPFKELLNHFNSAHSESVNSWVDGLFALPSDTEIRDLLDAADGELQIIKRKEASKQQRRRLDSKKKVNEKASVILTKPWAWQVVGELWGDVPGSTTAQVSGGILGFGLEHVDQASFPGPALNSSQNSMFFPAH